MNILKQVALLMLAIAISCVFAQQPLPSPSGGGGGGMSGVTSVTIAGTTGEINVAGTCAITSTGTCTLSLASPQKVRTFGATFTNAGGTVTTGTSAPFRVPYACTISSYNISLTPSGTATLTVWKIATGTAIPTVSNSISTAGVSLSTGTSVQSSTVTDFTTTAVALNDLVIIDLTAVGGSPTAITYSVECDLP